MKERHVCLVEFEGFNRALLSLSLTGGAPTAKSIQLGADNAEDGREKGLARTKYGERDKVGITVRDDMEEREDR